MTFQSPYLVKLQDLKVWQGNYDSWLENRSKELTNPSDLDTIEGLSALTLDSSRSSGDQSITKNVDWDTKAIIPAKPFEQLLEEKLAEDQPVQIQDKPKRPFLKKGTGLVRYKLSPKIYKTKPYGSNKKINSERNINNIPNKNLIKTTVDANTEPELSMMPLKMPNIIMKQPKATWAKIPKYRDGIENNNKTAAEPVEVPEKHTNSNIIGKINEFALKHFLPQNTKKTEVKLNNVNVITNLHEYHPDNSIPESSIYFENTGEKDLRIFEALEERVEHSSFSSTNSSIIRLLASTPNKVKKAFRRSPIQEEKKVENNNDFTNNASVDFNKKLNDVNKKSDILQEFLNNLKKLSEEKEIETWNLENDPSGGEKLKFSDTSYSESEKCTGNTDTSSYSPSSFYTDFENTLKGRNRIDVAVNTSVDEKTKTELTDEKCPNCDALRMKLERVLIQLSDLQKENAETCDHANGMEKKRDQLLEELHKWKMKYEEDITDLKKELDDDKKKFAKEKAIFDLYIKESQNRPTKMEREELSALKKELSDVKALLKLKETKNGATQARLRNQIKMLEKDRAELKTSVENLQKENSKLNASQKMRRPTEVKMLHEINRNLTKLTEEAFKKHITKSDISNNVVKDDNSRREIRQNNNPHYDPEISPKLKRKSSLQKRFSTNSAINDNSNEYCIDMTTFANLSLEKQYENMFGDLPSTGQQNNSLNDSKKGKTEIVFPDGSKEIKYSNGNSKTISPDSNLIIVQYYNGDIKETNVSENTLKYYYAENATWHTQFGDGMELLEYPNGQKERKYKDGRKEVTCPDGSFFIKLPDGTEEVRYPDGSKMIKKNNNEEKILLLPNGQKEIHTKDHKRREYPDGTVKILYPDGTQETRYASGRVRIKDANGVLILDSEV